MQWMSRCGLGYGRPDSGLVLNLVYNPQELLCRLAQGTLEADYKRELEARCGIVFNRLLVLANMPIQRLGSTLWYSRASSTSTCGCCAALTGRKTWRPSHVLPPDQHGLDRATCTNCDLNQMLGLPLRLDDRPWVRLSDLMGKELVDRSVMTADPYYGCIAGQGSGYGVALAG